VNALTNRFVRAIYVEPAAVVTSPDYAARLVDEAEINVFVLRTGFSPVARLPGTLERAIDVVRSLESDVWFLVGAWWGNGFDPIDEGMVTVAPWSYPSHEVSHEARWNMATPGAAADDAVEARLRHLVERFDPDGVCLTHARFRHPANIPGLFEIGGGAFQMRMEDAGVTRDELASATRTFDARLRSCSVETLRCLVRDRRLPAFLDAATERQIFSAWFRVRSEIVTDSVARFGSAVRAVGSTRVVFGVNAYAPAGAALCGQDYVALHGVSDFLQPLLGYVRWHLAQPVHAWANFLMERVRGLDEATAVSLGAELFGLQARDFPRSNASRDEDDGFQEAIGRLVALQLQEARRAQGALLPVVRGGVWPRATVAALSELVAEGDDAGIVYQGTDALVQPVPGGGWE
jgi:hypothetical protein